MEASKKNFVTEFLGRWFRSPLAAASEHQTDYQALGHSSGGLDAEYQRLVEHHLRRWGVPAACATVDIQQIERRKGKREVFVATVCLNSWERNSVLRILIGFPMLDKKIRQAVAALWLADVSDFEGVQLKVSPALNDPVAATELRHLLVSLTGTREAAGRRAQGAVPLAN